jgi:integrin-linked kinase-associated serine/threonine phosphatase 2C
VPDPGFVKESLFKAFVACNEKLKSNTHFDTKFSGSTTITALSIGSKFYIANVGDSRAILIRKINDSKFTDINIDIISCPLSRDHKPEDSEEAERIMKNNGRIAPFKDYDGNDIGPK